MAHRRRKRARRNPLEDSTKIAIAVGVTVAVVGVGYFLYKRSSSTPLFTQGGSPQQGQGGVQSTPPPGSQDGGSDPTISPRPTPFKLGDMTTTPQNTPNTPPPDYTSTVLAPVMSTRAMAQPAAPDGVHAPRTIRNGGAWTPKYDFDPNA